MRSVRAVLLTIVATVMLVGGIASTANASTTSPQPAAAAADPLTPPASNTDPKDPGIPD